MLQTICQDIRRTADCKVLQKVITLISSQKWYQGADCVAPYKKVRNELSVVDELVTRGNLIVIPTKLRHKVVSSAHSSHQGIVKTKNLLRQSIWFPGMTDSDEVEIKACIPCLATKTRKQPPEPLLKDEHYP